MHLTRIPAALLLVLLMTLGLAAAAHAQRDEGSPFGRSGGRKSEPTKTTVRQAQSTALPAQAAQPDDAGKVKPVKAAKVLVLPFEVNASPDLEYLNDSLPLLLSDKLREAGFEVVPQDAARKSLQDQKAQALDLRVARQTALLLGAEYAVYGSFTQLGESISIDSRLVDAFALKPAKPLFVTRGGLINVLPAVEELADKVRLELMQQDRIDDVEVQGVVFLEKDVVLTRLESQKGDAFDPARVNRDLRKVFESGYFDDVQALTEDTPQGKKLIFQVVEKPRLGAVSVEGSKELSEKDIRDLMTTQAGSVLNLSVLSQDLNKIREEYKKKGYYKAKVDYQLEGGGQGQQARLKLVVDEGRKLYVRRIAIKGAKQISEGTVKDELAMSERGIFSWITGSGVLKEELLDRDTAAIEALYANRGYLEAKVGKPVVEYKDDGIYVTYNVSEGPRYRIESMDIVGDLLESPEALKALTVTDDMARDKDYLDRSKLRQDVQRLVDRYTDYGYAFAEANLDVRPDAQKHTVAVTFNMVKNQKVYVRRVILEGNLKTRDNVLLREMRLTDGDQFSGTRLARSSQRLTKLDYFEQVDIETVPTGREDQLDLKIKVKEKPTGMISAGVGYSSYSRVFFGGQIQERNLFGKGYNLGFSGSFSAKDTLYNLSFTNPHVYDTNLSFGVDSYVQKQDFIDYDKNTVGGRLRLGYPLGEYTRGILSYRLDHYEIKNVSDDAALLIRELEGKRWASVAGLTLRRDTTNRPFNPSRGTDTTVSLEYGGGALQGDDNFIKWVNDFHWYQTVFWKTVFHFHTQLGMLYRNFTDEDVPIYERFFLGGLNTVRGYSGRRIAPYDEASDDRIGGVKELFFNFEYVVPIDDDLGLLGVIFFDAGNTWTREEDFFDQTNSSNENVPLGLYKSVGLGLRWLSPLGPLRLEYGYPLDSLRNSSASGRFEFSLGTVF